MPTTQTPSVDEIADILVRSLATQPLSKDALSHFAAAIQEAKHPVIGVDVCTIGKCVDFRWDGDLAKLDLNEFLDDRFGPLRKWEIFPEGIVRPETWRIRITHAI